MTINTFTDKDLIIYRKQQYMRGFWVGFFIVAIPAVVGFSIFCHAIINIM
jgi:hypothetical protein